MGDEEKKKRNRKNPKGSNDGTHVGDGGQRRPPKQGGGGEQRGPPPQGGGGGKGPPQQGGGGGKGPPQQGGDGGQRGPPKQGGGGGQRGPPQQGGDGGQRGPPRQGGGGDQRAPPQQGGDGGQRGPPKQGGGGGQRGPPQQGGDGGQRGPPKQGGGGGQRGPPQQGGDGGQRGPPRQGGGGDQRAPPQQGGDGGQRGPPKQGGGGGQRGPPQQGGDGGQRGSPREEGGGDQRGPPQQGGHGGQRGPPRQEGGGDHRGPFRQGGGDPRGPPRDGGDQRGPPQQSGGGRGPWGHEQRQGGGGRQQQGGGQDSRPRQQSHGGAWQQQGGGQSRAPSQQGGAQSRPQQVPSGASQPPPTTAPSRAPELSTQERAKQLASMATLALDKRPTAGGTQGMRVPLFTNHFHMRIDERSCPKVAYHYDVEITPDKYPKRFYTPVWDEASKKFKVPSAFDGRKNVYTPAKLFDAPAMEMPVTISDPNEPTRKLEFQIKIQLAAEVDMRGLINYSNQKGKIDDVSLDSKQCLEIVLNSAPSLHFTRLGRSFFRHSSMAEYLDQGMELWVGFFQSVTFGATRMYTNIDVSNKAFPKQQPILNLIMEVDQVRELRRNEPLSDRARYMLKTFLKGLKVTFKPPGTGEMRVFKVNDVTDSDALNEVFEMEQNGRKVKISVADYFSQVKKAPIQFVKYPLLWVGSPMKRNCIPMEFCEITPNQVINRPLSENQTRMFIRHAATRPGIRKERIMQQVEQVNRIFRDSAAVKSFGVNFNVQMEGVEGRVIGAPDIQYKNKVVRVMNGVWQHDSCQFYQTLPPPAMQPVKWFIINLTRRVDLRMLKRMSDDFVANARNTGLNLAPVSNVFDNVQVNRAEPILQNMKRDGAQLVLCVISGNTRDRHYAQIKSLAELKVGILTQCVKQDTCERRWNASTISNIILKVNAKLNGINHVINKLPDCVAQEDCMVIGADVTHPSPGQSDIPSVAAVSASSDGKMTKYNYCWRLQDPRQEMIDELDVIIHQQLQRFQKANGRLPNKIIFYRDGVADCQFAAVMSLEVNALRNACRRVAVDYKPRITFLVVQKRHHTRFFPLNERRDGDRNGNVKAGLVVDSTITDPNTLDFFLCSHAAIQGTARPTRYRVLFDENKLTHDSLEQLTYYLCHLFTRCNRSVSYPAPTYYAHLAAFRARHYITDKRINMGNLRGEMEKYKVEDKFWNSNPMYFV